MRYAVVDLGSNSIRMSVYEEVDDKLKRIFSQKELIGIIGYVKHSILSESGTMRIISALKSFSETAKIIGVEKFSCFATASLRNLKNSDETIERVKNETGVSIDLISGEDEAQLDFIGARSCLNLKNGLLIDMGGGSTEIIRFEDGAVLNLVSLPFGSLYLFKKKVKKILPTKKEIRSINDFVAKQLDSVEWLVNDFSDACIIGGTARSIARLHQEVFVRQREELQGYTFDAKDIRMLFDFIEQSKNERVKLITRISPERIHTIIPGLTAFLEIIKRAGCNTITISRYGVREGYLETRMLKK